MRYKELTEQDAKNMVDNRIRFQYDKSTFIPKLDQYQRSALMEIIKALAVQFDEMRERLLNLEKDCENLSASNKKHLLTIEHREDELKTLRNQINGLQDTIERMAFSFAKMNAECELDFRFRYDEFGNTVDREGAITQWRQDR
jgi:uncharacterized protein YyaL (SSP411 family)